MITISTGQCYFEGASTAEHGARQWIYIAKLRSLVTAAYRRHEVRIQERRDDGATKVTVSRASLAQSLAMASTDEAIADHIRELSNKAWMHACQARLWRVAGHGGKGQQVEGVFSSRSAAVGQAKPALGNGVRCEGVAVPFADGAVGVYLDRSEARQDATGAGARYTVQDVSL